MRHELMAGLPVTQRQLPLAGISTAIAEGGSGVPLVLLHGPMGSAVHWMNVIPELVRSFRVIAPDLPGHGASSAGGSELSAEQVLAWLDALVAATCPEPPILVGQLLGGAIAARYASAHPERIRRLVLANTFGLRPFQPEPDFGEALHGFLAKPTRATHTALWRRCAFDLDDLRARMHAHWPAFEDENLDRARDPEVQRAVQALMGVFGMPEIAHRDLAAIQAPTALIWGRHDRATPLAVAEETSRRLGWPLYVIESANDDPPIEQPAAFVQALRRAVRENSIGRTA